MNNRDIKLLNAETTIEYYMDRCELLEKELNEQSYLVKSIIKVENKFHALLNKYKIKSLYINSHGLNTDEKRDKKVIVSLTSYPGRINFVPETIKTMLLQTYKPDMIILWLGEEKFPNQKLPPVYEKLRKCGVNIFFRPDLKSHTKYFYAMQEYPNDIIITVDDDSYYENTLVEKLMNSYFDNPDKVSALRTHKIRFNNDFTVKNYSEWIYEYKGKIGNCSHSYMATGVGGVLYPPHILPSETFNLDVIKNYCHNHDDWWLKIMEVMGGIKVVLAENGKHRTFKGIRGSQKSAQWRENVVEGGNDQQMNAVLDYYKSWNFNGYSLTKLMALDIDVQDINKN